MLTVNVDTEDRLVNGSIGTIVRIVCGSYPLNGTLYIDFDDKAAGNSRKLIQFKRS